MTAAYSYDELHHLVDRLTPRQAEAVRGVVLQLVSSTEPAHDEPAPGERRRRLPFAGLMSAEPDLAERSEDILRAEFGTHSA
jgi:hypothetical protein